MSQVWHRITGACKEGRLVPDSKDRLKGILREMDGQRFELAIRPETKNRTLPQNSKIHVLARAVAEKSGDDLESVKDESTLRALGVGVLVKREVAGITLLGVKDTHLLDTKEGSAVIEYLLDKCEFLDAPPPRDEDIEVMP